MSDLYAKRRTSKSPFNKETPGPKQLPSFVVLAPRSFGGQAAAPVVRAQAVTVTQPDTGTVALLVTSAGVSFTSNLSEWRDGSNNLATWIGSTAHINATQYQLPTKLANGADPAPPSTGCIVYVIDDGAGKAILRAIFADGTVGDIEGSAGVSA